MLQYQQPATDLNHTRPALSTLASIASDHSSHLRYVLFLCVSALPLVISISAPVVWLVRERTITEMKRDMQRVQEYMYVCMYVTN